MHRHLKINPLEGHSFHVPYEHERIHHQRFGAAPDRTRRVLGRERDKSLVPSEQLANVLVRPHAPPMLYARLELFVRAISRLP
jgi:hypothetical protein